MNDKKNAQKSTAHTPDPIEIAKRRLDEARIDYKRIKEIAEGERRKQEDPKLAAMKKELSEINARRKVLREELRKTAPNTKYRNQVDAAKLAVLEAEVSYRKTCLGN